MANPRRRTARIGGGAPRARPPQRGPHPHPPPTPRARPPHPLDNPLSRGTPALVGWLAVGTIAVVTIFTAIVKIAGLAPEDDGGHRPSVIGQVFKTFLHALDPGTVAGDTGKWPFLLAMI